MNRRYQWTAVAIVALFAVAAMPSTANDHESPESEPFGPETGTFFLHFAKDFGCQRTGAPMAGVPASSTFFYATNVADDVCALDRHSTQGAQQVQNTGGGIDVHLVPQFDQPIELIEGAPITASLWIWMENAGGAAPEVALRTSDWTGTADTAEGIMPASLEAAPGGLVWQRFDVDLGPAPAAFEPGRATLSIQLDNGADGVRKAGLIHMGLGVSPDHKSTLTLPLDEQIDDPVDPVDPDPSWPGPLGSAKVRPGVQHVTGNGQCTTNFVFRDTATDVLYMGTAAHCVGHLGQTSTIRAIDGGTSIHATVAFISYGVPALHQSDFALLAIDADDEHLVHPAMLHFGGPTHLVQMSTLQTYDKVITYGNSGLRPGPALLDAHEGYVTARSFWYTSVYTVTPGIFGDSGSGIMTASGGALGAASTIAYAPIPGENRFANIPPVLDWMNANGWDLELQTWELIDEGVLPAPFG